MQGIEAEQIGERLRGAGLEVGPEAPAALARFLALLERWNRVHNLTAIRGRAELIERHLIESLALAPLLRGSRVADVGSGAGLPGIPLAIADRERSFTLIESRAKRVGFLRHVVGALALENVVVSHGRAEDLRSAEPFDTVLARAVAPLGELVAITRHLTGPGSMLVVATGAGGEAIAPIPGYRPQPVGTAVAGLVRGSVVYLERIGD